LIPLTFVILGIFTFVIFTTNFELKISSLIINVYVLIFVIAANVKFRDGRLYAHQNWIFVPFISLSIVYFIYGFLKIADLFII
jgi:hypothetical protein